MKLSSLYMVPADARSHFKRVMKVSRDEFGVTLEVIAVVKVKVIVLSGIMRRIILRRDAIPANVGNASTLSGNMPNAAGYKTQSFVVSLFLGFIGQQLHAETDAQYGCFIRLNLLLDEIDESKVSQVPDSVSKCAYAGKDECRAVFQVLGVVGTMMGVAKETKRVAHRKEVADAVIDDADLMQVVWPDCRSSRKVPIHPPVIFSISLGCEILPLPPRIPPPIFPSIHRMNQ